MAYFSVLPNRPNLATTTPSGQHFDRDYGVSYAAQVLSDASCFIWAVFNQTSPAD